MNKKIIIAVSILTFSLIAWKLPDNGRFFEISKNIEIFTNLYKDLNTYYVDDIDPGKLMKTGIDAMLNSLDPYTNYFSENQVESWRYMTEGKYNGIGAIVKRIGEYPTIIEPYEGFGADKAGLKAGDQIVFIDGRSAKGRDQDDVMSVVRGVPGTTMDLVIRRPGEAKDFPVKVTRLEVQINNVPYSGMVSDNIGYIQLTTFTQEAAKHIIEAFKTLKKDHPEMKGVILDLRDNGGGLLNEAVNICNAFLPKGQVIVSTRGKVKEWDRTFNTMSDAIDAEIPLAVLINKRSASASEIVSGTIQDLDRGVLIGQRSFGKGLVQNTRDVGYNAMLKVTTSKYYIPSGRCIQSVSYKDGEPVDVPDSLRTPFKTRNGRKVLDGGGIAPDIKMEDAEQIPVIKALMDQDIIFQYVTQYIVKNPKEVDPETFKITDYEDFIRFTKSISFTYETESEKALKELTSKIKDDKLTGLDTDIKTLESKIKKDKSAELIQYKSQIGILIEKEIVGRFHKQNGKAQYALKNDKEIDKAVEILNAPAEYKKLLKSK